MSLYADYIKEREGIDTLEVDGGFATYNIEGDSCYIINIYTIPEMRKTGLASQMADQIAGKAKLAGCRYLLGSVDPRTNGATESMKVLLAYGFKLQGLNGPLIFFSKEL